MKGIPLMLRRLGGRRPITAARLSSSASSSLNGTVVASSAAATYCSLAFSDDVFLPLFNAAMIPTVSFNSPANFLFNHTRSFSAAASSGPSKMLSIDTEEQLNDSLRKAQDDSMPAIFYFTAVWCGPCKLISPYMGQLSEKYPHVAVYKIDIDKEGLGTALSKLNISAVGLGDFIESYSDENKHLFVQPTIQFFHKGKKASEVVGADVNKLSATMKDLYE